jgi:hypothetical protein
LLKKYLLSVILLVSFFSSKATLVKGLVFGEKGEILPFTSISVKDQNINIISNERGEFSFQIMPGEYFLLFMHVGYKTKTFPITITDQDTSLQIRLELNSYFLSEVKVRPGGEDPAFEIIRNAIRARKKHHNAISSFSCNSYIKGLVRTGNYPATFMGQKIDFEDGDTSKKKIIFLSETIADFYFKKPNYTKVNVTSTKVSGQTNGFGLSTPSLISFYENTVKLPSIFNPRGFLSPIADAAFTFYNYQYLGAFEDDGVWVNKIKVWPKRKWEPLFTGYIQIIEDSWNIHSLDLTLSKDSQLEIANHLSIKQQMAKKNSFWMLDNQSIYLDASLFGFEVSGYFTSLFSDYRINIDFGKDIFNDVIIKYDSLSNKRTEQFWNDLRPLPLLMEEKADYLKKDSLEIKKRDPVYIDSLDRIQNRISFFGLIFNGETLIKRKKSETIQLDPLLESISYNTVEGWSLQISGLYNKQMRGSKSYSFTPVLRYGINNGHFNAFVNSRYQYGRKHINSFGISIGKKVFQFNNANPVSRLMNTFSTQLEGKNYLKIYEAQFFDFDFSNDLGKGIDLEMGFSFQNRIPLHNLSQINLWSGQDNLKNITANYPTEISSDNMKANIASVWNLKLKYRPRSRYIEFPDQIIRSNGNAPTFTFNYIQGIPKLFNSESSFAKWNFSIAQELNFKFAGELKYLIETGGFFSNKSVFIPDYNHFAGNLTRKAMPYVQSFQVAPFYALSSQDRWFNSIFFEYSFNGMLTNKIPVLRRLNLRLITGSNMIFMPQKNYAEFFIGMDNIFKLFRVDYVWGIKSKIQPINGIKIGIKGFTRLFTEY